jgi:hypothetical protein
LNPHFAWHALRVTNLRVYFTLYPIGTHRLHCPCFCCKKCSNLAMNPTPGRLPPSLGDLLDPEEFLLENNVYTGALPESWGKLRGLKKL